MIDSVFFSCFILYCVNVLNAIVLEMTLLICDFDRTFHGAAIFETLKTF